MLSMVLYLTVLVKREGLVIDSCRLVKYLLISNL